MYSLLNEAESPKYFKYTLSYFLIYSYIRPCGKESTEVRITQNKGKLLPKIEEITIGKAHANTRKLHWNILIKFLCVCVCLTYGKNFPFPFPYFVLKLYQVYVVFLFLEHFGFKNDNLCIYISTYVDYDTVLPTVNSVHRNLVGTC